MGEEGSADVQALMHCGDIILLYVDMRNLAIGCICVLVLWAHRGLSGPAGRFPAAQNESGLSIPRTNAVSIAVNYLKVEAPFETIIRKLGSAKLKKLEDKPEFGAFVNRKPRATKELVTGLEAFTTALDIPWNHGETNARCHIFYNERTHVIFLRGLSQAEFLRFTNALSSNAILFSAVSGPGAVLNGRSTK